MSSNLPDGVSDSHPYFNPPREDAFHVECGNDEAAVIPAHVVQTALEELVELLERIPTATAAYAPSPAAARKKALELVRELQETIPKLEQEREYECPFADDLDLPESECAQWVCPVCGTDRETDTLPEERDPDEEWERRNER